MNRFPPLTIKLLWACLFSLIVSSMPSGWVAQLMLWPIGIGKPDLAGFAVWQFFSHFFIQYGFGDFLFLGLTLAFFGTDLENIWGGKKYGKFLLVVLIGANLAQFAVSTLALSYFSIAQVPIAGATSAMYGILFACAYLYPNRTVMLLIPPIPAKMKTLVLIICTLAFVFGYWQSGPLSQFKMLAAIFIAWLFVKPPRVKKVNKKPNHLRSV